jgi:hypothetical protein
MHNTRFAKATLAAVVSGALGIMIMNDAIARPSVHSLDGMWGGRQIRLHAGANGAMIEMDCAQGHIEGPIKLDHGQHFIAKGSYEAFAPGPQQADIAPAARKARYSGTISGDTLTLDVAVSPKGTKQSYTLTRGKNVKIIRCY